MQTTSENMIYWIDSDARLARFDMSTESFEYDFMSVPYPLINGCMVALPGKKHLMVLGGIIDGYELDGHFWLNVACVH